jgi:hypothetical protein
MESLTGNDGSGLTRRQVLKGVVRVGVMAGLVVGLTVLARRGGCEVASPCEKCRKFEGCDLEKAVETREERGKLLPQSRRDAEDAQRRG